MPFSATTIVNITNTTTVTTTITTTMSTTFSIIATATTTTTTAATITVLYFHYEGPVGSKLSDLWGQLCRA